MRTFTDNAGRTWTIAVNVAAIARVRTMANVDLLCLESGNPTGNSIKLLDRLESDPVLLCNVLYALCHAEAVAREVSDEEFGRAMAGDAIAQATAAFVAEWVDFSPSQSWRAVLRELLAKRTATQALALTELQALVEGLEPAQVLSELRVASNAVSGSAPESSESTPAP